jgi:hypothetical protein
MYEVKISDAPENVGIIGLVRDGDNRGVRALFRKMHHDDVESGCRVVGSQTLIVERPDGVDVKLLEAAQKLCLGWPQ